MAAGGSTSSASHKRNAVLFSGLARYSFRCHAESHSQCNTITQHLWVREAGRSTHSHRHTMLRCVILGHLVTPQQRLLGPRESDVLADRLLTWSADSACGHQVLDNGAQPHGDVGAAATRGIRRYATDLEGTLGDEAGGKCVDVQQPLRTPPRLLIIDTTTTRGRKGDRYQARSRNFAGTAALLLLCRFTPSIPTPIPGQQGPQHCGTDVRGQL